MCNNSTNNCSNIRNLPAVICVCTPERKENFTFFEGGSSVNKDGIALMSMDDIKSKGLIVPNDTVIGSLLIRYPFSQYRYIFAQDVDKHKCDKYYKYREILLKLGAKVFSVVEATKTESTMHFDEKGKLTVKAVSGKEKVDIRNSIKSELGFELVSSAEGIRTISDKSYAEALDLVREYNLLDDDYLMSLIKTRNPQNENHDHTLSVQMYMMDDFNKKLEIAAAFQVAGGLFNISAQVQKAIENKTEYFISVNVEFPV